MRFKHKPTKIEAFQWTGGPDQKEDPVWAAEAIDAGRIEFISYGSDDLQILVRTPEGQMAGRPGCWVAKGVEGELYIIQPELFEQLYEFDADGVIDTWAGNWIVTVEAPNGLQFSHVTHPGDIEHSVVPAAEMILGGTTVTRRIGELFDRRHEKNPSEETVNA